VVYTARVKSRGRSEGSSVQPHVQREKAVVKATPEEGEAWTAPPCGGLLTEISMEALEKDDTP
jgi:hypothetical protein